MRFLYLNILFILPVYNFGQGHLLAPYTTYTNTAGGRTLFITLEDNRFEFVVENTSDCSPYVFLYGVGVFEIQNDTVTLTFDSIPCAESTYTMDSIKNNNDSVDIHIKVFSREGEPMNNLELNWSEPRKKGRRTYTDFFSRQFDGSTHFSFHKGQKVYFIRIEKQGYYSLDIDVPDKAESDYKVEIELNPRFHINSVNYFPYKCKMNLIIRNQCELECDLFASPENHILKNERCQ